MKTLKQRNNRWIQISQIAGVVLLCAGVAFVVVQFRSSWQGPRIELDYPVAGQTVQDPVLTISGTAYNIAQLYIHGRATPIQLKTNRFTADLALPMGATSITLDGYTRSGRHARLNVPILHIAPVPGAPLPAGIELLQKLQPTETPFRATSDLLDIIQKNR